MSRNLSVLDFLDSRRVDWVSKIAHRSKLTGIELIVLYEQSIPTRDQVRSKGFYGVSSGHTSTYGLQPSTMRTRSCASPDSQRKFSAVRACSANFHLFQEGSNLCFKVGSHLWEDGRSPGSHASACRCPYLAKVWLGRGSARTYFSTWC